MSRLGNDDTVGSPTSGLLTCAVCQADLDASSKPWQGPLLCVGCRDKKDAMEGKRPSGIKVI